MTPTMKFTSPGSAEAYWVIAPGRGEIRSEPLLPPGPDAVLVRSAYSGVSRGTERLVFQHRVPVNQYQRMRAPFQAGEFPAPVKYGYSSVGRVLAGPGHLVGRDVFCLHPHQTFYTVPAAAVLPIPADVPPARAVLAAGMETALNGLWDSGASAGDRITVVGGGAVGCLATYLAARMPGCEVQLVDTDSARAEIAERIGVTFRAPADALGNQDVVVHASATAEGLNHALTLAGPEATVVELSWFGDQAVALRLGEAFHSQRLVLRSSQVGRISPGRCLRWDARRRLGKALELLADPALDALIGGDTPFAQLNRCMERIDSGLDTGLCQRIVYD